MKLSPKLLIVASALVVIALYITNNFPVIDQASTQEQPALGITPSSTKEQSKTERNPQNSNSRQPSEALSPAEAIKQDINNAYISLLKNGDLTHNKNVELHYQESLALAMHLNPEHFQKQWFPKEWRSDYIEQTECVQRHLKWHTFMGETLPKLQQEYARLTQPNSN